MRKNVETLNSVSASLRISVCPKQQVVPLRYASKIALRLRKQSTFYDEFILALPEDLTCTMESTHRGGISSYGTGPTGSAFLAEGQGSL